jgi:hypothetical protein
MHPSFSRGPLLLCHCRAGANGGPIPLASHEKCPDYPGRLIGLGHTRAVHPPSCFHPLEPATPGICFAINYPEDGAGAMEEEGAKVAIPTFRDPEQCRLPAGGMLPGDETEPGGKLPPILEARGIANGRNQGGRRQGPDAGQLYQPLTGFVSLTLLLDPVVGGRNTLIQRLELLGEGVQPLPCRGRQAVLGVFQKEGQFMPNLRDPLRDHQPLFR